MTIYRVGYCNRSETQRAVDLKPGLDVNDALDRAIMSAAENIDAQLHRRFYPSDDTRYFDWPSQGGSGGGQYAEPWRLWLDDNDMACLTQLVSGGVTIPLTAVFLNPANNPQKGLPFTYLELDRSQSFWFGNNAQTPQNAIAATSTWGFGADADPAGTLTASVATDDTTVSVSDGSKAGPGDLIVLGYGRGEPSGSLPWAAGIAPFAGERVLVTDVSAVSTGLTQEGGGCTTASSSDQALSVTGSGSLNAGEVIVLDQEDMLVEQVVSGIATVRRAWNGTTLAPHSDVAVSAYREFGVLRAQLGTTAVSASQGDAVHRHRVPQLVRDLSIAQSSVQLLQEGSGYARTTGSGDAATPSPGVALAARWAEARTAFGRKSRYRGV